MTQLSVNVNKLATLRNSREKNLPDVALWSQKILEWGANGITVHPRPDGRHIRWADVEALHSLVARRNRVASTGKKVEFNVEGFPAEDFLERVLQIKPHQCTLVPDPPEALTSNAGWNLVAQETFLTEVLRRLKPAGCRVSLFVDPHSFSESQQQALLRLKPERIELYTEAFADHFSKPDRDTIAEGYRRVAKIAQEAGIGVNAGHDLNQQNLGFLINKIPWIAEVSIGHALVCEALEQGMQATIHRYCEILRAP